MYVTPVTRCHPLCLWMPYLLGQCGVTVWEASCSSRFLRMTGRQDRLWQQPLWLCSRSLPPTGLPQLLHPGWVHAMPPQRLSSCFLVGRLKKKKGKLQRRKLLLFYSPEPGVSVVYYLSHLMWGRWYWWKQEADATSLLSTLSLIRDRRSVEFRCGADSQAMGTGSGIRGQIPLFHVCVNSVVAFCLITPFLFSKRTHLSWRRLALYKRLCVFVFSAATAHWAC